MTAAFSATPPGRCLSKEGLAYLEQLGHEVRFDADEIIVRRGEVGRSFYVVLSGEVEVRLAGPDGASLPLARLGKGATFGEMALISGEPVSADVVAVGEATLLACPEQGFLRALAECEALRMQLLARLAGDLQRTTSEAWDFSQRAQALNLLIRCESRAEPLILQSPPMRQLARALEAAAREKAPCLITGEAGTGKLLIARTLHEKAHRDEAPLGPLIIVDCRRLRSADARRLLLGPPGMNEGENALRGLGALHLAQGGSLVLCHVDNLSCSLQEQLAGVAESPGPRGVRLIATQRATAGFDTEVGPLYAGLTAAFRDHTLLVPPLRKRRRDIAALTTFFLSRIDNGDQRLGRDAENALLSMDFQQGNAAQLRETVEFAARCADGCEIRSEHIFSGLESGDKAPGIDLGPLRGLQLLLRRPSLTVIRATVLAGFMLTIALCLALPESRVGKAANGFIWSVWEPLVFALFLLVGSVWCTVCPLSTAGRLLRHFFSREKSPPERLKRWDVWLMTVAFFGIIWAEHVFDMVNNPTATALMLLGLILASMSFCALYTREVWCRHVCPLGALATSLAPSAILEVGARPGVCTSTCVSHNCYKGEGAIPGCTVFHHPLNATENHHCKLCLDCLKSCPHDSAKLYLRPPLAGIWRLGGTSGAVAPFAVAVFLLSLSFLAAQTRGWFATPLELTLAGVAAIAVGIVLHLFLPALVTTTHDSEELTDSRVATQVSFALMALGWGPLMAYQLGNIPMLRTLVLEPAPGSFWASLPLQAPWAVMAALQVLVVILAGLLATIALARIQVLAKHRGTPLSSIGWTSLWMFCTAYVVTALVLIL